MRSQRTLIVLAVVSILCYIWAENATVVLRAPHYDAKVHAAERMAAMMDTLRQVQYARGIFPDEINDPNLTALIGQQYTKITTDIGDLEAKWTALNPNMAAVMVTYLKQAELSEGDVVAAGMSGSLPGMNLAFYAACEELGVKPIVITSIGASSWGANDPSFTWLDMEQHLIERGLIDYVSIAASTGGGEDLGRRLSPEGRELIRMAAERNAAPFIKAPTVEESVRRRMALYQEHAGGEPIKLYINIGGGLASLGSAVNADLIPPGLSKRLPVYNYPRRGVINEFADQGVPVLQILNIADIANQFNLPYIPEPLPEPGDGSLFSEKRYNLWVAVAALAIVLLTLAVVLWFDRRTQRLNRPGVDPDTLI